MASPAYDNLSTGSFSATTTKTVSHTPVSVVNGIVFACLTFDSSSPTNPGITYNGVAMTLLTTKSDPTTGEKFYWFYLIAPPSGAKNAIASWTNNGTGWLHVYTYINVDQISPLGTPVTASGNGTTPTVTVTGTTSGNLVLDQACGSSTLTSCAQTQRYRETTIQTAGASEKAGGGSVVMSWGAGTINWAIGAVELKALSTPVNLKTFNGLAKASLKTINGLAMGSVKTINSLT